MSFCPYCGVKNDDAHVTCISCGQTIKTSQNAEPQQEEQVPQAEQPQQGEQVQQAEQPQGENPPIQQPVPPVQPLPVTSWQQPVQQPPWQQQPMPQHQYNSIELKPAKKTFYIVTLIISIILANVISIVLSILAITNLSNYQSALERGSVTEANRIVDNCRLFMIISWVLNIFTIIGYVIAITVFVFFIFSTNSFATEYYNYGIEYVPNLMQIFM